MRDDLTILAIDDSWVNASGSFDGRNCPGQEKIKGTRTNPS